MKGLPDHFGTVADISNCIAVDPAVTKLMLQALLNGCQSWVATGVLAAGSAGVVDATHQVRIEPVNPDAFFTSPGSVAMQNVQYQLQDDPLSQLFRLGLSVAQVSTYIAQCG